MKQYLDNTFSSLKIRNYRIYYIGQIISYIGTFLQALAQDWLVLKLTNSGTMLGLVLFFQFFPMLILTFYGGTIADRHNKLKLLFITQTFMGLLAIFLGILVLTNTIQIWMVFIFALLLGLATSLDNPSRHSFIYEMVGKEHIKNAVSLWTVLISFTRIIGPAIAGFLIAIIGIGWCFIINAVTFGAVLISLLMIKKENLHVTEPSPPTKNQLKDGLKYVATSPLLFIPLIMMGIIGTITFEWQASMPLFAKFVLNGDAATYALISVALSIGMLIGGLANASSKTISYRRLLLSALFLGISIILGAFTTNLIYSFIMFVIIGTFFMAFANLTSSSIQVNTDPKMRGRVMALWSTAFFGSTAIGGPLIGWIGEVYGAKWSLIVGGIAAIIATFVGYYLWAKYVKEKSPNNNIYKY